MKKELHEIFSKAYDGNSLIQWQDNDGNWSEPGFIEAGLENDGC